MRAGISPSGTDNVCGRAGKTEERLAAMIPISYAAQALPVLQNTAGVVRTLPYRAF